MTHCHDRAFSNHAGLGLTKREYFAALALQGLLADSESRPTDRIEGEDCCQATARLAVEHADCLIKALNK